MAGARSLTHDEARERAALLAVERYDIDVDLTRLLEGEEFRATSTITFRCLTPGSGTFVDCVAEVEAAVLNGEPIDPDDVREGRIVLIGLEERNTLVVSSVQRQTGRGSGVHRAVDPSDGLVYVWTTFEPDDARRAWACFDQPDLKAPFAITVTAPAAWTVLSNSGDPTVSEPSDGARTWAFPDTPPMSTYIPVVNAGPLHEMRSEQGGYDLGLYARRSLAPMLERDAEELFAITGAGLAFYGERFELPFPQRRYDQVFMPEFGGAMENYGCVTWSDVFVYREPPTFVERQLRAQVLLHEMAHMWFGDMVTMRWWDDLWLNESFADWACAWSAANATEFTDIWTTFLANDKQSAYLADKAPTTHPIRQRIADTDAAAASFDAITYPKGASVLKQLVAFVGEDRFVEGLRAYFRKHAWGNATLEDLFAELDSVSGRDLASWRKTWLETSGTDRLTLEGHGDSVALRAVGPDRTEPRPHVLQIGLYDGRADAFTLRRSVSVEVRRQLTPLALDEADLVLLNDDDLTFASVRPDPSTLRTLVDHSGGLPTAMARTLAVTTVWDMLTTGEVTTEDFVRCATGALLRESTDAVVEPLLTLAVTAGEYWSPDSTRDELLASIADACLALASEPAREQVALRMLARTATTPRQLAQLEERVTTPDLKWRRLSRLAELGRVDLAAVDALEGEDPNPDAWVKAVLVRAAQPNREAKQAAWEAMFEERRVPAGMMREAGRAFWRPSAGDVLRPFADAYIAAVPSMHEGGMLWAMVLSAAMFPRVGVDKSVANRLAEAASRAGVSALVAKSVRERVDELRRMLRARRG
ncbi:aminopeptidase N [Micromonospora sp. RTP1Z1]|uniref:aminopeptidase N n=1 Tax=Micromonospora sp. RTP1Z1 TaxID=2994043 RepID=UPI0029C68CE5|nr:aminopeptidase N [Micromonospora sp. RTP1Z1]